MLPTIRFRTDWLSQIRKPTPSKCLRFSSKPQSYWLTSHSTLRAAQMCIYPLHRSVLGNLYNLGVPHESSGLRSWKIALDIAQSAILRFSSNSFQPHLFSVMRVLSESQTFWDGTKFCVRPETGVKMLAASVQSGLSELLQHVILELFTCSSSVVRQKSFPTTSQLKVSKTKGP